MSRQIGQQLTMSLSGWKSSSPCDIVGEHQVAEQLTV